MGAGHLIIIIPFFSIFEILLIYGVLKALFTGRISRGVLSRTSPNLLIKEDSPVAFWLAISGRIVMILIFAFLFAFSLISI